MYCHFFLANQTQSCIVKNVERMKIVLIQHNNFNTMTSAKFIFYLTCLSLGKMGELCFSDFSLNLLKCVATPDGIASDELIHSMKCNRFFSCIASVQTTDLDSSSSVYQGNSFLSVQTGGNLTLKCFHEASSAGRVHWFKHILGQKPRLISSSYRLSKVTFNAEFKNPRFTVDTENNRNHLTITDLQIKDSATYNCLRGNAYKLDFLTITTVSVQGSSSNIPALLHQSPSETIQPGGSVTLNCTVQTGTCDGQHSVYWFKDSEESHPALIYTDGGSTDQCERKPNTQKHTCDYNLPMESLNLSHAGTYYCAVASCGHILFGNGTKQDFKDEKDSRIYFLSGALTFTIILNVLLVFLLCMMNKRNRCEVTESHARYSAPFTPNTEGERNESNIQYAAVREQKMSRSRRQRNNLETECTYSTIKQ
ncbi:polymeric immunoglobulin receptor-like isoform X1 [Gasterosteus aculeatus]